ncbi:protein VACUOLELESS GAMETOPHYTES-like [Carex rostrata]
MASRLSHFSHDHELVKTQTFANDQFYCDLCNTQIKEGPRYRCHACNFDLHEDCAKLPEKISFFAHPWHNLHLGPAGKTGRVCDLCMEVGTGFFYRCFSCSFDVHPHCTTTKQMVSTGLHPEHSLFLSPAGAIWNSCTACKETGESIWLYRCGMCNVNLHMKCLHGPIKTKVSKANNSSSREGSSTVGRFVRQVAVDTTVQTIVNSLTDLL